MEYWEGGTFRFTRRTNDLSHRRSAREELPLLIRNRFPDHHTRGRVPPSEARVPWYIDRSTGRRTSYPATAVCVSIVSDSTGIRAPCTTRCATRMFTPPGARLPERRRSGLPAEKLSQGSGHWLPFDRSTARRVCLVRSFILGSAGIGGTARRAQSRLRACGRYDALECRSRLGRPAGEPLSRGRGMVTDFHARGGVEDGTLSRT